MSAAAHEVIADRSVKAARIRDIQAKIARRCSDPGFDLDRLCSALGPSRRYVQQVLEETGKPFSTPHRMPARASFGAAERPPLRSSVSRQHRLRGRLWRCLPFQSHVPSPIRRHPVRHQGCRDEGSAEPGLRPPVNRQGILGQHGATTGLGSSPFRFRGTPCVFGKIVTRRMPRRTRRQSVERPRALGAQLHDGTYDEEIIAHQSPHITRDRGIRCRGHHEHPEPRDPTRDGQPRRPLARLFGSYELTKSR